MKPVFQKPRGWAAVFFGDTTLELTTAWPSATGLSIDRQTSAPLPAAQEGVDSSTRFGSAVQQLRAQVDPRAHRIITAVGGEDVFCQMLRLPTADAGELKQMLDLQIDNLTPLPAEDVVYSFELLETTGGETRLLLAVASKTAVNERVAALEAAGLPAEVVCVDALAVFRELSRREVLPRDDKLNALVLVSPSATNIIIHSRGNLVALRSLVLGSHGIAEAETQTAIHEELQRTLVATEVDHPGAETGRVMFATWSDTLREGVAELARGWGASAEFLSNGSAPTPSVSVCMETARAGAIRLNLLPEEWRERRRAAKLRRTVIRGAIAVASAYVLALLVFLTAMGVQQARVTGLQSKIAALQGKYDNVRKLHKTLVTLQKQLDTKYSSLEVLREVSLLLPDNVKLNGFTFKKDDSVTLRAQAQSAALAHEYISRLEKRELFSKVTTGAERTEPGTGLTKFDVVCSLKSAAPAPGTGGSWR